MGAQVSFRSPALPVGTLGLVQPNSQREEMVCTDTEFQMSH